MDRVGDDGIELSLNRFSREGSAKAVEDASRRVEERVTAHNDKYTPTVNRLRTSYTPGSSHRFVGHKFRRHVQTAVRAGVAALLVGVWHLEIRLSASYLSAAIAVLCSCASIGGTIQRAAHALGGSLVTVPLALACVVVRAAGSHVVGICSCVVLPRRRQSTCLR